MEFLFDSFNFQYGWMHPIIYPNLQYIQLGALSRFKNTLFLNDIFNLE